MSYTLHRGSSATSDVGCAASTFQAVAVVKAQIPENLKGSQNIETTSAFYILQASAAASATVEVALVADSLASNDGFVAAAPEGHFCALRYGAVACYLQARPKQSALSGDSDDSGEVHASIEDQTLVKLQLCALHQRQGLADSIPQTGPGPSPTMSQSP